MQTLSFRVSGATGPNATSVNGNFDPTDEICEQGALNDKENDSFIYQKRGNSSVIVELYENRWQIKPSSSKGQNSAWASVWCAPIATPDNCRSLWSIAIGNSKWEDQESVVVQPISPPAVSINISGVTGCYACIINGNYDPVDESVNDSIVYQKRESPDTWVEYYEGRWQVKPFAARTKNIAWAEVSLDRFVSLHRCYEQTWAVAVGKDMWEEQPSLRVVLIPPEVVPILISGATGSNADNINGNYDPSEEVSNGVAVYKKRGGSDCCLEYYGSVWQLKPTSGKGKNVAWATLHCNPVVSPEKCVSTWHVSVGGSVWESQLSVTVGRIPPAAVSVRISGATGCHAVDINAIYDPTPESVNGAAVYHQRGNQNIFLRLYAGHWQVRLAPGVGSSVALGEVKCGSPLQSPEMCVGVWSVNCGCSEWEEQISVVLRPEPPPATRIMLAGATGPYSTHINGSYNPTDEVNNGATVYQKSEDRDVWLEYFAGKWQVKPTSGRNKNVCWASQRCDLPASPEGCTGAWEVAVESSLWEPQESLRVEVEVLLTPEIGDIDGGRESGEADSGNVASESGEADSGNVTSESGEADSGNVASESGEADSGNVASESGEADSGNVASESGEADSGNVALESGEVDRGSVSS